MARHDEDRLHKAIADYMRVAAPPGLFWTSIENRKCGAREGGRRKARGCKAGVPDILMIWQGIPVLLEVKTLTGRPSSVQKACHEEIKAAGGCVHVVRSIDDVEALLKSGLPALQTKQEAT